MARASVILRARYALRHPVRWLRSWRASCEDRQLQRAGWPGALIKACGDRPWEYALMLRTGELVHFTGATHGADLRWVSLDAPVFRHGESLRFTRPGKNTPSYHPVHKLVSFDPILFDRGVEIRVADIVWVTDAPWGS